MKGSCRITFNVGDVLNNKWVILEFIGKGGMGEVYRAHQIRLNRDVAIKVVSLEWLESIDEDDEEVETLVHRFSREVQAMAQIRHPNILQIFDHDSITVEKCNEEAPIEYIAMEYIPGGSLRATMSEEGFFPEEAAVKSWINRYFMPVLAGVKALHDIGIIHRDLKPENILMDNDTPKIADFGLARSNRLKPITQSMDIKGSLHYMSPEHMLDFKRADQRVDVYSLGKILFEVVEGKIKSGTTPFKTAKLTKPQSWFFQKLDNIIQQTTAESRDDRIESVQEFHFQLEQAVNAPEIQKQIENTTKAKSLPLLSRPKWIWAGIAVAMLSVLLMTVWHLMGNPGLNSTRGVIPTNSATHELKAKSGNTTSTGTPDKTDDVFFSEHLGKQHFIPGGEIVLPTIASGDDRQTIQVEPFYVDEFFVTNQQFVDFLNQNLAGISIENGVVKGNGANWLLLGEVHSDYEPIVYRNGEFHTSDISYTSSPVLRVTGYGAFAFATFFGRRLPTEVEMLYAMIVGGTTIESVTKESSDPATGMPMGRMMGMMDNHNDQMEHGPTEENRDEVRLPNQIKNSIHEAGIWELCLPAAYYTPNRLGIRGLREGIGEWVLKRPIDTSEDQAKINQYAVIGGMEGAPEEGTSLPGVVGRLPWEGFEEIGFRTVKSAEQ